MNGSKKLDWLVEQECKKMVLRRNGINRKKQKAFVWLFGQKELGGGNIVGWLGS